MIDTLKIFNELKEAMGPSAAQKIAETMSAIYDELRNTVTKEEFNELKGIVRELVEAQKRTEQRVEELAEAQKRTEQRVEELVEAQKRTEQRVEELVEAQKRTEQRVEELAEAQKRTEVEVRELAKSLRDTRTMVGGLSDTVGYGLEDRAIKSLPSLLKSKFGIEVSAPLVRKFVRYNGRQDELNIFGTGRKARRSLNIVGEAKARLSKKQIDDFLKMVGRLEDNEIVTGDRILLIVTYSVEPAVEEYAREKGVEVIWSYEV